MASSLLFVCFSASLLLVSVSVSSLEFQVGGKSGWSVPEPSHNWSYNLWATENRFHVNDTLYFEYRNDSVLVVNYWDYRDCVTSDPILRFEDGNTLFVFHRHGFFYFISGRPGHCQSGQKLVIRVMVHPLESDSPGYAPKKPPSSLSSSSTTHSVSYFLSTAAVGLGLLSSF